MADGEDISIHALREEGDAPPSLLLSASRIFLSTPSARRATVCRAEAPAGQIISIHALREEGDRNQNVTQPTLVISIHALREEGDQEWADKMGIAKQFLSTPSARRATTINQLRQAFQIQFLSTPSARRATSHPPWCRCSAGDFYPRPPRGGRRSYALPVRCTRFISIHALREEGDQSGKAA